MGLKLELRKPKHPIAVRQNHKFDHAFNIITELDYVVWGGFRCKTVMGIGLMLVDANQKLILDSEE